MTVKRITSERQRHSAAKKHKILYAITEKRINANGKEQTVICKYFENKEARDSCFNHLNNPELSMTDYVKIKD